CKARRGWAGALLCVCCTAPQGERWEAGRGRDGEMAETGSVHATRFEAAVKVIQSLPKNGECGRGTVRRARPAGVCAAEGPGGAGPRPV
uniref:Uncharacterized protein n=1 Tax=Pavo cristatus TaxID=9049 RepID=A0A8C9LF05_PAVCR